MKKALLKNAIVALIFLIFWLTIDWIDVKWQRMPSSKYDLPIVLSVLWACFGIANRKLFSESGLFFRVPAIMFVAAVIAIVWSFVSAFIILQFHVAIGGTL